MHLKEIEIEVMMITTINIRIDHIDNKIMIIIIGITLNKTVTDKI
jgi:hypothetical protein